MSDSPKDPSSSSTWSDEELELLKLLRPCCSTQEIYNVFQQLNFDRTMEAISRKGRKVGLKFLDFDTPNLNKLTNTQITNTVNSILDNRGSNFLSKQEEDTPRVPLTSVEKAVATTKRKQFGRELLEDLIDLRKEVPRRHTSLVSPKTDKQSAVFVLSDLHIGEVVKDHEAGQVIFNTEIALDYLKSIPQKIINNLGTELNNHDELVLVLAGDLVDGESIFDSQPMHIDSSVSLQFKNAIKSIYQLILDLKDIFGKVRVITCQGNHGRTGGVSEEANWDKAIYLALECLIDQKNDPDITIKNHYREFNIFEVKGWKIYARHIAPIQVKTAGPKSKILGWVDIHGIDAVIYGHYHHPGYDTVNNKHVFRNGSLPGGNDYSEGFGCYDEPSQIMFTVSNKELPTSFRIIRFN